MIPGIQSSISRFRTSWRGWEWLGGRRVGCLGQFMETSVGHGQCTKKCCECCCYTPTSALRLFDWSSNLLRPFLFDALAIFINSGPQVLRPQTDAAVQVEEVGAGLRQIPEACGIYLPRMLKIVCVFFFWMDVTQTVFPSLTLRDWRTESRYQSVMIPGIQSSISRFRTSWRGWEWLGGRRVGCFGSIYGNIRWAWPMYEEVLWVLLLYTNFGSPTVRLEFQPFTPFSVWCPCNLYQLWTPGT